MEVFREKDREGVLSALFNSALEHRLIGVSWLDVNKSQGGHLGMRGWQALADVDAEERVLAQGDVELEEERLAQVQQGPPEDARRHVLTDPPAHLQLAHVYAAVSEHPWP